MEPGDSVAVFKSKITAGLRESEIDTFAIPDGNLFIPITAGEPQSYYIHKVPRRYPDGSIEAMTMMGINVPVMPDADIRVEGDFYDHVITGNTPFYDELAILSSYVKPMIDKAGLAALASYKTSKPQAERDSLKAVSEACRDSIQNFVAGYVADHPDSDAGLYAFYMYADLEEHHDCLEKFSKGVRTGVLSDVYDELVADYEALLKQKEAEKAVADGMPAPDFTLNNAEGKPVSLSSFRGKYVVLDFWGTWCGWCIKGIPEMKDMYARYNNRLEVVGISCRDTEEVWKKGVADHALPWTNLLNGSGDADVTSRYAIKGYPTKIVLDPEGRILKTIIGESPEFYTYIDSLMTK